MSFFHKKKCHKMFGPVTRIIYWPKKIFSSSFQALFHTRQKSLTCGTFQIDFDIWLVLH